MSLTAQCCAVWYRRHVSCQPVLFWLLQIQVRLVALLCSHGRPQVHLSPYNATGPSNTSFLQGINGAYDLDHLLQGMQSTLHSDAFLFSSPVSLTGRTTKSGSQRRQTADKLVSHANLFPKLIVKKPPKVSCSR